MRERPLIEIELALGRFTLRAQHHDLVAALTALGDMIGVDVGEALDREVENWRGQRPGGGPEGAESAGEPISGAEGSATLPEGVGGVTSHSCTNCRVMVPQALAETTLRVTGSVLCTRCWK